jgi:diguanylate cyclase
MLPILTATMAAVGGALVATGPVIAMLHRARRDLHRARHDLRRALTALNRDDLTELASRRAFLTFLDGMRRARQPVAVVLVDLDRFKQVNDRYGHQSGDQLLCQVANRLRALDNKVWLAARLAGDEFVLAVDVAHAATVTVQARRAIAGTPFTVAGRRLTLTASAGYAIAKGCGYDKLLPDADRSMYQAKGGPPNGDRPTEDHLGRPDDRAEHSGLAPLQHGSRLTPPVPGVDASWSSHGRAPGATAARDVRYSSWARSPHRP